jgi:hypothetical protein
LTWPLTPEHRHTPAPQRPAANRPKRPSVPIHPGKGYAAEGSRALIARGFTEFGVQRVVAEAMAVNTASRRVMEKAGLTLVRTFHQPWPYRIEGDQFGDVEYALDKADWQHDQAGAVDARQHERPSRQHEQRGYLSGSVL